MGSMKLSHRRRYFFFSSRRRHTRCGRDWSSDVCSSDLAHVEVIPFEDPALPLPVHALCIRDMGLTLGEMFDLDELAADSARDGVWEVLFSAPPLKVAGGIGSPLNPLAVK